MKNIVRAFVVALVITGAAATSQIPSASAQTQNPIVSGKTSALPIPVCPPSDPDGCGIGKSLR
jgi:hypothetical protein